MGQLIPVVGTLALLGPDPVKTIGSWRASSLPCSCTWQPGGTPLTQDIR